jgi:hypothetical protein
MGGPGWLAMTTANDTWMALTMRVASSGHLVCIFMLFSSTILLIYELQLLLGQWQLLRWQTTGGRQWRWQMMHGWPRRCNLHHLGLWYVFFFFFAPTILIYNYGHCFRSTMMKSDGWLATKANDARMAQTMLIASSGRLVCIFMGKRQWRAK